METMRLMELHRSINKPKKKPNNTPKDGTIILNQDAAREYLGL